MKNLFFRSCVIAVMVYACEGNLLAGEEKLNCTKEELMMFFPPAIVKSVLKKADVPNQEAEEIAKELGKKDHQLAKMVDEKGEKQNPNPFKDLSQRDRAIKIYQETLFEVFAGVLKAHGIDDEDEINILLDEVRTTKSKLFIECIRQSEVAK